MNDNLIPTKDGQTGGQNGTPANLPTNFNSDTNTETTPAFIGMNSPVAKPVEHSVPTEPVKPVQSSATPITSTSSPYSSFGSSTTPSSSVSSTPSASASTQSTPSASTQSTPSAFASHTTSTSSTFSNSTPPVGTIRPSAYTPVTHINTHPHNMAKVLGTIISVFILLLLVGGGYYFYATRSTSVPEEVPVQGDRSAFPPAVTGTNTRPVATTTQQNTDRIPTARETFNQYIKQNINSLSPIKTTGTFTVSNVRFDGANRAIVTYTDGRNTYNAAVNYVVASNRVVTITDFTVLTK